MDPLPEPSYDPAATYALSGRVLNLIFQALRVRTPIAGPDILLQDTAGGFIITATAGGSITNTGAFRTLFTDDDGHTILQGGSITGGNGGSHTFDDYKVIDVTTGPVQSAGTILLVQVNCEATIANGLMLPGCKVLTTGHAWDTAATLPDNHSFTTAAATGDLYYEIGRWTDDAFLPAGSGNLHASGCIGDFHIARA